MKLFLLRGETSVILPIFIRDSSSSIGAGLASLDETSNIVGGYMRRNGLGIALAVDENVTTEGTYEAPTTAAQVRIGTPANMRAGTYELHFHDDLFATGVDYVSITLGGATNMAELQIEIQLIDLVERADLGFPEINQAFSDIQFLMVLASDHVTPATGLTVTGERSINGGAYVGVDGTIAEVSDGTYQFDALAADMNGGTIMFKFSEGTADDTFVFIKTRPA